MNNIRYFLFSSSQMKLRQEVESKLGRIYSPSLVLVNGEYKQYTEIVDDPNDSRFSDSIIVTYGDIRSIKYIKK